MSAVARRAETADFETTVSEADGLDLRAWLRLLTCSNLIEGNVRRGLRESFETTLPRFDVLAQLERAPDGLTMGELSRRLMVTGGNVTGLTARLVSEGLVEREADARDHRVQRVRLTATGARVFAQWAGAHRDWIANMTAGVDQKDMARLYDLLGKLKASVLESTADKTGKSK